MTRFAVLLVLLASVVSGCAPAVHVSEPERPSETLAEVNAALAATPRTEVTVWFTDGDYVLGAREAVVSPVAVRFVAGGEAVAVPVERVREITTRPGTRAGLGALVGAAPGIYATGVVLLGADRSSTGLAPDLTPLLIGGGVFVALGGAALGALAGRQVPAGDVVRLYRAPVSCYLVEATSNLPDHR